MQLKFTELLYELFGSLKYFIGKTFGNKIQIEDALLTWMKEIVVKNKIIHENKNNKDKEKIGRSRGHVFWIDFGVNIGSEFNFPHFCVVIKEFKYTCIVAPLSSEKEDDAEWKSSHNLIVRIGKINGLPNNTKECYAMINQIRTVSKQRLSYFKDKTTGKYISNLKLNSEQMSIIDNMLLKLCNNNVFDNPYINDYY